MRLPGTHEDGIGATRGLVLLSLLLFCSTGASSSNAIEFRQLTETPMVEAIEQVALSPDATLITYASAEILWPGPNHLQSVKFVATDGSGVRLLFHDVVWGVFSEWNAAGQLLVYQILDPYDLDYERFDYPKILVVDPVKGWSGVGATGWGTARWSQDGRHVVLIGGAIAREVDIESGEYVAISLPRGTQHVFGPSGLAWVKENHIWVSDDSGEHAVTSGSAIDAHPTWSPDGQWIAYDSEIPETGNTDIWVVSRHGSTPVQLTRFGGYDGCPSWARGTNAIAFLSDRTLHREVWLMTGLPDFTTGVEGITWSEFKQHYRNDAP